MIARFDRLFELERRLAPAALPLAGTSAGFSNWSTLLDNRVAVRLGEGVDRESVSANGHSVVRWLDDRTAILEGTGTLPTGIDWTAPVLVSRESGAESVALDEVIVALKPGVDVEAYFQDERFSSYRPLWGTTDQFVATLKVARGLAAIETAQELQSDDRVEWSEANLYQDWQKHFDPNDTEFASGNMWHHRNVGQNGGLIDADVDTDLAWDINPGGSASRLISVVDDGLETSHPDLNPWVNPGETPGDGIDNDGNGYIDDINGWNFVSNNNQTLTTVNDRHGTAVAGVAAAKGNNSLGVVGPSYNARVMIARIFENGATNLANISSAIYYAAGRNKSGVGSFATVHVQNNSWGGADYSNAITAAYSYATTTPRGGLGTIVTISTGNDYAGRLAYPGLLAATNPGIIAVGATNNKGIRSDYANFGTGMSLVAPSSDLRSNYLGINTTDRVGGPGYNATDYTGTGPGSFGGTSASAPLVAGIAGLVLSQAEAKGVNLSATQMRSLLMNGTDLIGGAVYDINTGHALEYARGRINAFTSVDGVGKPEISVVSTTAEMANNENIALGNAHVGSGVSRTFRIRNAGTSDLSLANLTASSAKNSFTIENGFSSSTLKLGEAATFTVRFAPAGLGADNGSISFTSNDADEGSFTLNFTGVGIASNISGRVFEDWNGNAVRNDNDPALAGRTVYLDTNNNGTLDRATFTNNTPVSIPDNNANGTSSTIAVSGVTVPVRNVTVTVNLTHQYLGDVALYLGSPSGTAIQLAAQVGGNGTSFTNTIFDDASLVPIDRGASPFTGSFRLPFDPLSRFDGEAANGNWILYARDHGAFDVGTVQSWNISFDDERAVTSDSQGQYAFSGLTPGSYNVRSVVPAGWSGTALQSFVIANGSESFANADFAAAKNNRAYFRVRHDTNGNGSFEMNEPYLAGRTVYHDANTNAAFDPPGGPTAFHKTASLAIPDNSISGVSSTFNISGLTGVIGDVDVTVNVLHPFVDDLELKLTSPAGTTVTLISRRGQNGFTFANTVLDDSALVPIGNIINLQSPFTNSYRPESPLAAFNGQNPNGTWTLTASDLTATNTGTLNNWKLSISTAGESSSVSAANGNAFLDLPAGANAVRLAPLAGWKTTVPASGLFNLNAAGMPIYESVFGVAESVAPTVTLPITINNGTPQRSIVTSLKVSFSELVSFTGPAADAFSINGGGVPFTVMIDNSGAFTTATLSFAALPDGNYSLAINAALIQDAANNLLVPVANQPFHALLGDFNGDATVDAIDFAVFGNSFGSTFGNANYFAPADFNSDSNIDATDLALFGNRIGVTI